MRPHTPDFMYRKSGVGGRRDTVERRAGDRQSELSYASQLRNRYPEAPETKAIATGKCE